MSGSPFESGGTAKDVSFSISPKELTFAPDKDATIRAGDTTFAHFVGSITISLSNKTVHLQSDAMSVTFPLQTMNVTDFTISTLSIDGTKLELKPDISTDSADIDMKAFTGTVTATPLSVQFAGTTTQLKVKVGELNLEVV